MIIKHTHITSICKNAKGGCIFGSPKKRWLDNIKSDMASLNISENLTQLSKQESVQPQLLVGTEGVQPQLLGTEDVKPCSK